MCRLRGFLISTGLGPAEPLRIMITALDANEGNFPQGRKKINAEQIKSDDFKLHWAWQTLINLLAGNEIII